ncbi:MAG: DUF4835 family protein [Paludibacter sp.]|nr:DUF4835 family protein [Paludibacter sp.]
MRVVLRIVFLMLFVTALPVTAQELNCTFTINSDQVQGSNKSVFNTLQKSVTEFINNRRWTEQSYELEEKIECTMTMIVKQVENDVFTAELQVQSRRPVYNASYNTTLLNFRDNDIVFTYKEFDVLEFNQNMVTSNLTAILTYYVYLIIGYDMDSYSRMGGTPYFQAAEQLVASAQTLDMPGWRAFESKRNRYALINNLNDEAFRKFRNFLYEYHRLGLDEMTLNVVNARARISTGLPLIREANRSRPASVIITTFLDTKTDEIINIFKKATDQEKKTVIEILTDLNPAQSERYETIMKP